VLVEYWDAFRNASWAEALLDLFVKRLPDRRMLDLQTDGTADTALKLAVRSINVLVTRRLLEWGADPNIPNYKDGTPSDLVMGLVRDRLSKHGITFKTLKEKDKQDPVLRPTLKELRELEEIFALLKAHGAKRMRKLPPWKEDYSMPQPEWEALRHRHEQLGIDLKSINATVDTNDGPIREIYDEIEADIKSTLGGKSVSWGTAAETITCIIGSHLQWAPEPAYSSRRFLRVKQCIGELVGQFGASLHVKFDHERYGWQIELDRIPPGHSIPDLYVLSPPKVASSEVPLLPLLPEHQFCPATRKADLTKLDEDDDQSISKPLNLEPPLSAWQPDDVKLTQQTPVPWWSQNSPEESSLRDKLGPVGLLRLDGLLPRPGYRVVVGPEEELGMLFFPKEPIPAGHRVQISALSSGSHFSMTIRYVTIKCQFS
jgi:hypothetical protein